MSTIAPETNDAPKGADIHQLRGDAKNGIDASERLLNCVFHAAKAGEGHIALFTGKASYPKTGWGAFASVLRRSKKPRPCFYGTALLNADENNVLYNRKALFRSLHVVVIDDIGNAKNSKCTIADLPVEMCNPTYIIESSEGNYQFGYVLVDPITDLPQAEALISDIYAAGKWDGGGALVTKLVRLPAGVNGKVGERMDMPVTLAYLDENNLWTPEALREAAGAVEGSKGRQRVKRTVRAMQHASRYNFNGVVDPIVDWLDENNEIICDPNESGFMTIQCPWHDEHSPGGDEYAGYNPLGQGDSPDWRGFRCFHSHCSNHTSEDFLNYIADQSGEEYAQHDPIAPLLSEFVYDRVNDEAICLETGRTQKITAFGNDHAGKVWLHKPGGKSHKVIIKNAWLESPRRVNVEGRQSIPTDDNLLADVNGRLVYNTYKHPGHRPIEPDMEALKPFYDFIEYLVPVPEEREYFLNWLAKGVQEPAFRGNVMLMVATAQGTGRNTLAEFISLLHGVANSITLDFNALTENWTDWKERRFLYVAEVLSNKGNRFSVYEKFKSDIDTAPSMVRINPKYGKLKEVMCHTMSLMATNHSDAMGEIMGDRRMYIIRNPSAPHPEPGYYEHLRAYLYNPELWLEALYSDLKRRDLSEWDGYANAPTTAGKEQMQESTEGLGDKVGRLLLEHWESEWIPVGKLCAWSDEILRQHGIIDPKVLDHAKSYIRKKTHKIGLNQGGNHQVKINNRIVRIASKTLQVSPNEKRINRTARREIPMLLDKKKDTLEDILDELAD